MGATHHHVVRTLQGRPPQGHHTTVSRHRRPTHQLQHFQHDQRHDRIRGHGWHHGSRRRKGLDGSTTPTHEPLDVAIASQSLRQALPTRRPPGPHQRSQPELPTARPREQPRLPRFQHRRVQLGQPAAQVVVSDRHHQRRLTHFIHDGDARRRQPRLDRLDARFTKPHDRDGRLAESPLGLAGIEAEVVPPSGAVASHVDVDDVSLLPHPVDGEVDLGRRHDAVQRVYQCRHVSPTVEEWRQAEVGVPTQHDVAAFGEQEDCLAVDCLDTESRSECQAAGTRPGLDRAERSSHRELAAPLDDRIHRSRHPRVRSAGSEHCGRHGALDEGSKAIAGPTARTMRARRARERCRTRGRRAHWCS